MACRQAWIEAQPGLNPERLVFIDETGASTKMARRYGRAPRGERCRAAVPHGHWKTITFVPGLRLDGLTAPWVLDGPMHGDAFRAYTAHILTPTLAPGDIVVMDNLHPHKVAGIETTIRAAGASGFCLPPYSPNMNPIEMAFAKLKALLRQDPARTIDALWRRIGDLLNRFLPAE